MSAIDRVPRVKRKGRHGCYTCGAPTEVIVQVWMREYVVRDRTRETRQQRTVKSISVSMCREHGEDFYTAAAGEVPACRPEPKTTPGMAFARSKRTGR